ncbi:MAG: hypothetical protein JNL32_09330 [Candidatus Kapabacteria bacterium]|nr:hypothetical protein [Candidatus Kapabacteria bacterium]
MFVQPAFSQSSDNGILRSDFQLDAQTYRQDSLIGAPNVREKMLGQGFLNVLYSRGNFSAGVRYEGYFNPIQGIDLRYTGNGLPYRFARFNNDMLDVTLGNFYEQFGSGMILRTYEERSLGFDNSVDGIRVKVNAADGVTFTGLIGRQRSFFALGPGIVRGGDVNVNLNQLTVFGEDWLGQDAGTIELGASVISKFQTANDPLYNLPENVLAYSLRASRQSGGFRTDIEYAYKYNDPGFTNNRSFNPGTGLFVSAAYSGKGYGLTLNFKRIDNMDFRSDRTASLNNLNLNFLPPLTKVHTYRVLTLYPYATQNNGEIGFQGEFVYTIPKNSFLGGDYGTTITVNYANIHALDTTRIDEFTYTSQFFGRGKMLFQDLNIEIAKTWSKKLKTTFTFVNQSYDKDVIEGKLGYGLIHPWYVIGEASYQLTPKSAIRMELQHLFVRRDFGNWAFALLEYTFNSHWYLTVFDEFNYGNYNPEQRIHYYSGGVTYVDSGTRLSLSYGRTRAGILCVGGVCRVVPASNGLTLAITSTL